MRKSKLSKLERLDKFDMLVSLTKQRSVQILMAVGLLYMLLITLEIPFVFKTGLSSLSQDPLTRPEKHKSQRELQERRAPSRPFKSLVLQESQSESPAQGLRRKTPILSSLRFDPETFNPSNKDGSVEFHRSATVAWEVGRKLWEELQSGKTLKAVEKEKKKKTEEYGSSSCSLSVSLSGSDLSKRGNLMELPCGLTLGSHITLVGKPRAAHSEKDPKISMLKVGDEAVKVSQFKLELQGLKAVEGEDPPRILHLNPRLKGDWSGKPVIEQNTCYRMQWGSAQRCEGWRSRDDEETVDGQVKCEKWSRDDSISSKEESSKTANWWLSRLIRRSKKVTVEWPFPFTVDKLFVLTLSAGLEGYHVSVDGKHVTSFPYRTGFTLEDATGLTINGDIDVHSVFAGSLPTSHPSFAPQMHLKFSSNWQAPSLPNEQVDMFIGILSAGNHFAERMAVRKSWMQHKLIKSSKVVARFFVALHSRKEVNVELKKEAEFFGDIVLVPYMDSYDLVVLKTVAICEYGSYQLAAKFIMKCDDDTFVNLDAVLREATKTPEDRSLYIGNINYYHKPLRQGKWAVTYEEWPEEEYPPYANGPGYILSDDISRFIVKEFEKHKLRSYQLAAKFIMKCDDDTFVNLDAVLREATKTPEDRSLYIGNINYYHKPLRQGKWAVTYEEWPEEEYPPYANGPGYILSDDISRFIVKEFEKHKLRMFKMEDVSVGMWVEQFNNGTKPVNYIHSLKFCQFGCIENYMTAHYQSPRQMICLWNKLVLTGKPECCNMR